MASTRPRYETGTRLSTPRGPGVIQSSRTSRYPPHPTLIEVLLDQPRAGITTFTAEELEAAGRERLSLRYVAPPRVYCAGERVHSPDGLAEVVAIVPDPAREGRSLVRVSPLGTGMLREFTDAQLTPDMEAA